MHPTASSSSPDCMAAASNRLKRSYCVSPVVSLISPIVVPLGRAARLAAIETFVPFRNPKPSRSDTCILPVHAAIESANHQSAKVSTRAFKGASVTWDNAHHVPSLEIVLWLTLYDFAMSRMGSPPSRRRKASLTWWGVIFGLRPIFTPRAFALSRPSPCAAAGSVAFKIPPDRLAR